MGVASTGRQASSSAGSIPSEQTRRGRASVNSGWGERIADIGLGGALVAGGVSSLMRRRWLLGGSMLLGGGYFLYASATGHFPPYALLGLVRERGKSARGLVVERSITMLAPREEVYAYWRDLSHLPSFMSHLEEVRVIDEKHSHWVARAPLDTHVTWDAEITEARPNELLAWQSLPGSAVSNRGEVRFADAPAGRGTEVVVRLVYEPSLGTAGAAVARLFGEEPTRQVDDDLRRLKAILEAGEAPTTRNQPHGKLAGGKQRRAQAAQQR